jgi:hypothetical protein
MAFLNIVPDRLPDVQVLSLSATGIWRICRKLHSIGHNKLFLYQSVVSFCLCICSFWKARWRRCKNENAHPTAGKMIPRTCG